MHQKTGDYQHFLLLARVIRHLGVEITEAEANAVGKKIDEMPQLVHWLQKKIATAPFPPPPWAGNDMVKPVTSWKALKACARKFRNCAKDYVFKVVLGYSYLYVCESVPALIELKFDVSFGWEIDEMEGVKVTAIRRVGRRCHAVWDGFDRKDLSAKERAEIIRMFAESGFDTREKDFPFDNYADAVEHGV